MSTDVKEWWQEWDRRQHKKAARQIFRWVSDPIGEKLPDDWDLWDAAEEQAILAAWVNLMQTRLISPDDTPQMLDDADDALVKSLPQRLSLMELGRLRLFIPKLRAAWDAQQKPQSGGATQAAGVVPVRESEFQQKIRQGF